MPEALQHILTWIFLALLWLFFLRAIRAVWIEIRQQKRVIEDALEELTDISSGSIQPLKLRIVDPEWESGKSFELYEENTIGRASGCAVCLDYDDFVSQLHARVFLKDKSLWVEDLGSRNGTFVNEKPVKGATPIKRGDYIRVGNSLLEVYK